MEMTEDKWMLFSSKDLKTEPEEADICLPVDHNFHSSCSDSHSSLGEALESKDPKLVPDCVKTETSVKTERPDQTEESGHPAYDTLNVIKNGAEESNITAFKPEPADDSDDVLEEFMKQKTQEEAVNLDKMEDQVLRLSECEVSRSGVCCMIMYERIKISNGNTICPTHGNKTSSEPNTIHGMDESQSDTDSETHKGLDKKVEEIKKKNHICQICGKDYFRKSHLNNHMKTHGERQHRCHECGSAFFRPEHLERHMRIHSGVKPYSCDECGKSFNVKSGLREHQQRHHTGERPHPCDECGKRFQNGSDLRKHQMCHTGEKPFTCTQCGTSFQRSYTLKKHMRIHTRERPYLCSECGKTFPYAFSYNSHMEHVHNRKNVSMHS